MYEGMGQGNEDGGLGKFKGSSAGHGPEIEFYFTSYEELGKILNHGVLRSEVLFWTITLSARNSQGIENKVSI